MTTTQLCTCQIRQNALSFAQYSQQNIQQYSQQYSQKYSQQYNQQYSQQYNQQYSQQYTQQYNQQDATFHNLFISVTRSTHLKRMKIIGWRAKVEDRQEWNRIVEQTNTHLGL